MNHHRVNQTKFPRREPRRCCDSFILNFGYRISGPDLFTLPDHFPGPGLQNSCATSGRCGHIDLRQKFSMLLHDCLKRRIVNPIFKLLRVGLEVVKLFGSVRIMDVPISLASNAMVASVMRSDRWKFTRCGGIHALRNKAVSLEVLGGG